MKIQVIGLRKYTKKDGSEGTRQKKFAIAPSVPYLLKNIDFITQSIPTTERWNVYFTPAHCEDATQGNGTLRRFKRSEVLAFDIDNPDLERRQDYLDIFFRCTGLDPATTAVICSGNGLQLFAQLRNPFDDKRYFQEHRSQYKQLCDQFNNALTKAELPGDMDPSVFEHRRLMRLPNTINKKPKGESKAYIIQENMEPQDFDWGKVCGLPKVKETHQDKTWDKRNDVIIDHKEIFKQCGFMNEAHSEGGHFREPQFYTALSILARMENGRKRVHNLVTRIRKSGSDSSVANYSDAEIEQKIDASLESSGPRTCKGIEPYTEKCQSCPLKGTINSPISIKSKEHIATEKSGFMRWSKNGQPKPQFDDLIKFYDKKHKHIVIDNSTIIHKYENNHYVKVINNNVEAFAYKHFVPSMDTRICAEFRKRMQVTNTVPPTFFSKTTEGLLNCKNGVVDLKSGELLPHSPDYGFKYILPYDYDPEAKCERFEEFMNDIMSDDEELVNLLQEYGGYSIAGGRYKYHKILVLIGEGRNGKGTFMSMLRHIVGEDNYSTVPINAMRNENNRQLMEGKLFNFCDEVEVSDFKRVGDLKNMSGGGKILVKMMYNQPYQIDADSKLILACNEKPTLGDTTNAIKQRLLMVPFEKSYTKKKGNLNVNLIEELREETAGILNFFIKGYQRLVKQDGFTEAKAAEKETQDYVTEENYVATWIQEDKKLTVNDLNGRCTFTTMDVLHNAYCDWAAKGNFPPINRTHFGRKFVQAIPDGRKRKAQLAKGRGFYDIDYTLN